MTASIVWNLDVVCPPRKILDERLPCGGSGAGGACGVALADPAEEEAPAAIQETEILRH